MPLQSSSIFTTNFFVLASQLISRWFCIGLYTCLNQKGDDSDVTSGRPTSHASYIVTGCQISSVQKSVAHSITVLFIVSYVRISSSYCVYVLVSGKHKYIFKRVFRGNTQNIGESVEIHTRLWRISIEEYMCKMSRMEVWSSKVALLRLFLTYVHIRIPPLPYHYRLHFWSRHDHHDNQAKFLWTFHNQFRY